MDLLNGNIIEYLEKSYNRIKYKKNKRFGKKYGFFYDSNFEKVNSKLIPNNFSEILKVLGSKSNNGYWFTSKTIKLEINKLIFKGKFNKETLRMNED